MVAALGGNGSVLAFYDVRSGVTNSGGVTAWADSRGAGVNSVTLTPIDANKPTLSGTGATDWLITCNGAGLMTPASFAGMSGARTLIAIGAISASGTFPILTQSANLADSTLGLAFTSGSNNNRGEGFAQPGATWFNAGAPFEPNKLRLWLASKDASTAMHARRYPIAATTGTHTAVSVNSNTALVVNGNGQVLGSMGVGAGTVKLRALLLIDHELSAGELQTVGLWARDNHYTVGGDNLVVTEGDSITEGGSSSTTAITVWPYPLDQDAAMATWEVANVAVSGSGFFTAPGLNVDATRTPLVDAMIAAPGPRSKKVIVLWAGTNDIAVSSRTGAQVNADIATYKAAREAQGWTVLFVEILPRVCPGGPGQAGFDAARATVNAAQATAFGSNYIPMTTLVPTLADATNATYYSDGTHPNASQQSLIAAAIKPYVLAV